MPVRPTIRDFLFAVRYLTIVPVPDGGALGPATIFFPFVGMLIGFCVAVLDGFPILPDPARAALLVLCLAVLSRWSGLRGVALVGSGLAQASDRKVVLETMNAGRKTWTGYLLAAMLAIAKAAILLKPATSGQLLALLFAPMLGRWGMVVVGFNARLARLGAPGPRFEAAITFREFGWASVMAAGLMLAWLEAIGLLILLGAAVVSVVLRLLWHRWLGGVNETTFHATAEIVETAALASFALLKLQ